MINGLTSKYIGDQMDDKWSYLYKYIANQMDDKWSY